MGITVLLATYNRVKSLKISIQSILNQSLLPTQLVIVNDASTDETKNWLLSLDFGQVSVNIVHNASNKGLASSLNIGLDLASEPLIARIDDDDVWIDPDKLLKQVKVFKDQPNLVLLGTGILIDDRELLNPLSNEALKKQILFRCPFQHSTVVFKREINGTLVSYDENLPYSEDWDLWLSLGRMGEMMNLADITTSIASNDNLSSTFYASQHTMNLTIVKRYLDDYPQKHKAYLYHLMVLLYFKLKLHKLPMHRFFQKRFNSSFLDRK